MDSQKISHGTKLEDIEKRREIARFENVSFSYPGYSVLENINLSIFENDLIAVIGPNGGGKTTMIKLMLGLLKPTTGSVKLFGAFPETKRGAAGYLPQITSMDLTFPLSVYEAVLMGIYNGVFKRYTKEDHRSVESALEITGIENLKNRHISMLSGGQAQRMLIARALVKNPEILLLDEPTSGLDPIGIKEVRDIILDMQQRGATIFINSHLLSEVERTCSRVAIINKGRIVKSGNKDDLSNKEKYLEIVGEGFTDNLAAQLGAALNKRIDVHGNSMRIFLDHENDALTVHQMVITNGGSITSFNWVTESLEDIFFRLIKGEGA